MKRSYQMLLWDFVIIFTLIGGLGCCKEVEEELATITKEQNEALERLKSVSAQRKEALENLRTVIAERDEGRELIATAKSRIEELEAQVEKLSQTPEKKLAGFVERHKKVSSVDDAERLNSEIETFLAVHKSTPLGGSINHLKRQLASRIKELKEDEARAAIARALAEIRDVIGPVSDGTKVNPYPILSVGGYLEEQNLNYDALRKWPKGVYREATKDPETERGKVFVVSGRLIQITRDGDYFTGLIGTGGYHGVDRIYNFYTKGTTAGVYERKNATFAGVFVQLYEYKTRAGGSNDAIVLVGHFSGQ